MNGFSIRTASDQGTRWGRMLLGIGLLLVVWPSSKAQATPIRSPLARWERFVQGGPSVWSRVHAPPLILSVREALRRAVSGSDTSVNPMAQYLLWRRNRNPLRFDQWHPFLGPQIRNFVPHLPPPTKPSVVPREKPPFHPQPQIIPSVPEPNTILIAAMLIGSALWWRKRHGRSAGSVERFASTTAH